MSYSPHDPNGQATMANSEPVVIASDQSTIPVSAATLPLPSGASTSAAQSTGNTSLSSIDGKITAVNTGAVVVSSSALPSGAATAAKQPALGTAGTASADVVTVQGVASMTALKTDGSATTQPVSGTVTANIGTVSTLATTAKQDTGNTSVASIDTKTPALGQALAAASVPIVLTAAQVTTLTPPAAITGFATAINQPAVYTEDAVAASDPVGLMQIARRKDTLTAAEVSADGDNIALNATSKGQLHVKLADTVVVDASATTQPVSAATLPLPSGASTSAKQPALGTAGVSSTDVITVQGIASGTAQPISGTVTANAGTGTLAVSNADITTVASAVAAEDSASADADKGVRMLAVRKATPANTSGTDGDYEVPQMSAGRMWVDASGKTLTVDGSGVTQPVSIASVPSHAVTNAGTFAVQGAGDVAHDGVDSGNPVKTGGQARTTNPTAVSDADRSNFITDKLGKQVVVGSIRDLKIAQQTTITASTSETTVLTAVASTFLDVYGVIVANTSATACDVAFKDATAGTTRFDIQVPAGETRGFTLPESAAHNQAVVNNNWTATCSASITSIKITVLAVKNI